MNILCLNTAFSTAYLALKTDKKSFFREVDAEAKSSEKVLPEVEKILLEADISPKDLDVCAVVIGPGSFTGIRIGVAIAKGFSVCFEKLKFIAINSLDLMAFAFFEKNNFDGEFYAVQNALSNRFFISKYSHSKPLLKAEMVNILPENSFLVGLESENLDGMNAKISPNAEDLLILSLKKLEEENFVSSDELEPLYIRLAQAEENLKR